MRPGATPRLRRDGIGLIIVFAAYLAAASQVTNTYYQLILSLVPIWALFGVSWNLLSGYGGQLSFGHASFFGIGAYTVTLALLYWNMTPWLGIPLGALVGAIAGILIGVPTFRLRGHYFALAMLAYPLAILYVLQYLGFQEISFPMHREHPVYYLEFSDQRIYTLIAVALLAAGLLVCMLVENSRFGLALMAIRQNELAAEAAGIDCVALEDARAGDVRRDRRHRRRPLCLRAAGAHTGFRIRHSGLRAGRGGDLVRRRRLDLGASDRCRHSGAVGRITECRTGEYHPGHPRRGIRRCDHPDHAGLA